MQARRAEPRDWPAIDALVERARFTSPMVWPWQSRLGDEGFVVVELENRIEGALLACADESPVAWVRFAAVAGRLGVDRWLDLSLPPILRHLRTLGARQVTWMDWGEWAMVHLAARGFRPLTEVVTLTKTDRTVPTIAGPSVTLRPASDDDFGAIAAIDRRAFTPTWWRSEESICRRAAKASRFTVAEDRQEVVGYAERELHPPAAHLNRIAVDPAYQGREIGACLLKHVLASLWRRGGETISLNTQRSNRRSRRLYERFGFEPTGDTVTVWALQL